MQSYKNVEFLIIDDCSTDNTFKILQECSINNEKIKIFRNKSNIGLTRSLNLLISKADGILLQDKMMMIQVIQIALNHKLKK